MDQSYHLGLNSFDPISTKDKSRLHPIEKQMLPGTSIGYALKSGGGWTETEDLIIAHWHNIENHVASEVHVKRFKSKEVGIKKLQEASICPCADGFPRKECHAQRQTLRHQRVENFDAGGGVPSAL